MSTPEEIAVETVSDQPMNVATAVGQLRLLVCGLGVGLILVSLTLSALVFKLNRDMTASTNNHLAEVAQLQAQERPVLNVLNELARYSAGKPELVAIFTRHGLQFTPGTPGSQPP